MMERRIRSAPPWSWNDEPDNGGMPVALVASRASPSQGARELARFAARVIRKCGDGGRHACEELPRELGATPSDRSLADQHVGG